MLLPLADRNTSEPISLSVCTRLLPGDEVYDPELEQEALFDPCTCSTLPEGALCVTCLGKELVSMVGVDVFLKPLREKGVPVLRQGTLYLTGRLHTHSYRGLDDIDYETVFYLETWRFDPASVG